MLKGALGYSDEDISHFNGFFYARDTEEALAIVRSGEYDAAFLMRPTPVAQVRDVAAAGENMPPEVDLLLPQAAHRAAVQPARTEADPRARATGQYHVNERYIRSRERNDSDGRAPG